MRIGIDHAVPQCYDEYVRKFKQEGFSENISHEKAVMACIDRGLEFPAPKKEEEVVREKQTRKRFYDE